MANGKAHEIGSLIGVGLSIPASIYLMQNGYPEAIYGIPAAIAAHTFPADLDHHKRTWDQSRLYKINPLLGFVCEQFWEGYDLAIPHRSRWSHGIGIGSIVRAIYLFTPMFFYDIYQSGAIPVSLLIGWIALWLIVPRLLWRRKGNTKLRVAFLSLPFGFALMSGATALIVGPWLYFALLFWMFVDMFHLALDGFGYSRD